jgi:hypothetical protein
LNHGDTARIGAEGKLLFQNTKLNFTALLATCFQSGFFFGLFFDPEGGGDMFLRNVG